MTDNFQVVTRYTFTRGTENKVQIDYLRINDSGSPIIYKSSKKYDWEAKRADGFVWHDRYSVELIEEDYKIRSLSGQDRYEFTEIAYSSRVSWEPKVQALIDLEPYLDMAIIERYHALAAATLAGLTEEEKKEVTTFPDLDESFIVDTDGE